MSIVIGIDLGTTNSCVAVMEGGKPEVIVNEEGGRTTPSVVAFTDKNERLVGERAKRQAVVNANRTVSSIKRKMGTTDTISINGKKYLPQEISAMVLQTLKLAAEQFVGEPVTEAVITVPAYFNDAQRQATKEAGQIAGLNVKRIINEPTAAALAYGLGAGSGEKIMVYDLGGGTFDVSLIELGKDVVEVLATAGNNSLGGDDFDKALFDYIIKYYNDTTGINLKNDNTAVQRVMEAAEKTKKELSSSKESIINLPFIAIQNNEPQHLNITITRSVFENLIEDKIDSTKIQIDRVVKDANINISEVDKIILVGGSTRIPLVSEKIKEWTKKEPQKNINPDESVAMGAALHGYNLQKHNTSTALLLLDVTPLSLSVELSNGESNFMIKRNTTIPTSVVSTYTTAEDFQESVCINICQGERLMAADNVRIGQVILSGIQMAPKGVPQIEVTFKINEDGIVNVSAKDTTTKKEVHVVISSKGMTAAQIAKAIQDAEMFEEQDKLTKKRLDAKNTAEIAVNKAKKFMKQLDNESIKYLQTKIDAIHKIMEAKEFNTETLADAVDELMQAMNSAYESSDAYQPPVDTEGFRGNSEENQSFYDNF